MDRCRVGCWELGEWTGAGWVVESCGDLIRSWGEWTGARWVVGSWGEWKAAWVNGQVQGGLFGAVVI